MSTGRLIGAGLLAGLVLNVGEALIHGFLYAAATENAMHALSHEIVPNRANTAQLILITFVQGLLGMWLYSAVQPRWPAGAATAIRIGLILWAVSAVYSAIYLSAGLSGLLPQSLVWGPVLYELILYPVAIFTGCLVYRTA